MSSKLNCLLSFCWSRSDTPPRSADVVAANLASSIFTTEPREKQAWTRFRREILQKGGSEDEYTLLERFLGYPPTDTAAFFNMLED